MDKNLDNKGRWRNRTIAFRVSEEEAKLLDNCVSLSGLTKQDYIIRRLLHREVVVQGIRGYIRLLETRWQTFIQNYRELHRKAKSVMNFSTRSSL